MPDQNRESSAPSGEDRLIPINEVSSLIGLKSSAIYDRVRSDAFPRPVRLSQRCSRWSRRAVLAWVEAQKEGVPA
jgi:prophage regulatory protein